MQYEPGKHLIHLIARLKFEQFYEFLLQSKELTFRKFIRVQLGCAERERIPRILHLNQLVWVVITVQIKVTLATLRNARTSTFTVGSF